MAFEGVPESSVPIAGTSACVGPSVAAGASIIAEGSVPAASVPAEGMPAASLLAEGTVPTASVPAEVPSLPCSTALVLGSGAIAIPWSRLTASASLPFVPTTDPEPSGATRVSVSTPEVPGPAGPGVTSATGSVELRLSRTWEGAGASAAGRPTTGGRPGSSDSGWLVGCSAHPAARGGEPISGSGSTWTIPFSISSGPRCSPRTGVSPIPTCGVPPLGEPSGPEDLAGSSLGRSALSSSESISLCCLVPGSVENQPMPDSARCRDPAGPIADSSAAVAAAARGEMSPPLLDPASGEPPLMESAAVALSADADPMRWPWGSGSPGSPSPPSEVGCSTTRPSDRSWACAATSCSRSWSPGPAAPAS